MISETLLVAIIITGSGFIGYIAKLIYSSKCSKIKCGNCCEIDRNTSQEVNVNNINDNTNNVNLNDIAIMIKSIHDSTVKKMMRFIP